MNGYFFNGLHNFTWFYPIFFPWHFLGIFHFVILCAKNFQQQFLITERKCSYQFKLNDIRIFFVAGWFFYMCLLIWVLSSDFINAAEILIFFECPKSLSLFRMPQKFETFSNARKIRLECRRNWTYLKKPRKKCWGNGNRN